MKQQINLYQGGLRRERPAFSALAISVGLAVCILGLTGGWYLTSSHAASSRTTLTTVQRQEAAASERLAELTRTLAARQDDSGESDTLSDALAALAQRERLLELIDGPTLGHADGFSAPLRELAQHGVSGLWLTRVLVSSPDMRTTLEGRAWSPSLVPEYLLGLSAEGALGGQRFDQFEIEQTPDDGAAPVRFSMTSAMAERFAQEDTGP